MTVKENYVAQSAIRKGHYHPGVQVEVDVLNVEAGSYVIKIHLL